MSSAICFNLDQSKILSSGNGLITLVKKPSENIMRKGEMLVIIILSFFLNHVFRSKHFISIYFISCQCYEYTSFTSLENLSCGKEFRVKYVTRHAKLGQIGTPRLKRGTKQAQADTVRQFQSDS